MRSAIAVITYRRLDALKETLRGLEKHCSEYPISVWEDCGQRDGTESWLAAGHKPVPVPELMATEYVMEDPARSNVAGNVRVFLGDRNLGVAANSNRALKWFADGDWDHLCLMNDDLHVEGDFVKFYGQAHLDLEVGLWCFNDFAEWDTHRWFVARSRGYGVKVFPRMTGIMMSVTKAVFEKAGYFDVRFFMGQEHCDWTNRIRFAGGIKLDGQDQPCLDLEHDLLKHQTVAPSVSGIDRAKFDQEAAVVMQGVAKEYHTRHYYREFALVLPSMAGGNHNNGLPVRNLPAYTIVTDLAV